MLWGLVIRKVFYQSNWLVINIKIVRKVRENVFERKISPKNNLKKRIIFCFRTWLYLKARKKLEPTLKSKKGRDLWS